jgi:hypothetical protein
MLWCNLHLPSSISGVTIKKFLLNLILQNIKFRYRENNEDLHNSIMYILILKQIHSLEKGLHINLSYIPFNCARLRGHVPKALLYVQKETMIAIHFYCIYFMPQYFTTRIIQYRLFHPKITDTFVTF